MYRVLTPIFERTGESVFRSEGNRSYEIHYHRVSWVDRGRASDMEDAKARFGGSPVLEWIKQVH